MSLFTPAWKKDNVKKGIKSLDKLKSDEQLLQVVRESLRYEVAVAAIERIEDEKYLLEIISDANIAVDAQGVFLYRRKENHKEKATAAVNRITDDIMLAKAAKTSRSYEIRQEALRRIKNEELLTDTIIALKNENNGYGYIQNIHSKELLFKIASECTEPEAFCAFENDKQSQKKLLSGYNYKYIDYINLSEEDSRQYVAEGIIDEFHVVDYCKRMIRDNKLWGLDIMVDFLYSHPNTADADRIYKTILEYYQDAKDKGDKDIQRRIKCLKNGIYGTHADITYSESHCYGGGHHDAPPNLHFDAATL